MIASTVGILTASVLGSVHCAAMCGGFVCVYAGTSQSNTSDSAALLVSAGRSARAPATSPLQSHALYNVGRLCSYLLLGAIAGALGAGISTLGELAGIGRAATIIAGALMVGWGISTIAAQRGISLGFATSGTPLAWQRGLGSLLHRVRGQPAPIRALLLGLGTTLLPCGWLYVFVAAAAGTGSVPDAMLLMGIFWTGTLPAMLAVGFGAQRIFGSLRRTLPTFSAVAVLVMGMLAISGRLTMSTHTVATAATSVTSGATHAH